MKKNKREIICVGTGEYYKNVLYPSLNILENEDLIKIRASISIDRNKNSKNIKYIKRKKGKKLSSLLSTFNKENTVVVLSHPNHFHTPDTKDLAENGFKVIVEKPYSINYLQLKTIKNLLKNHPSQIALSEYYLMMKSIPLLLLAGKVKEDSFYFKKGGVLKSHKGLNSFADNLKGLSGKIKTIIGNPKSISVEILEGKGKTGKIDHRGAFLSDSKKGGGVIQDLGIHALSPIFALQDYVGDIDESFKKGEVVFAKCKEYIKIAEKKFKLPHKDIAETYAQIKLLTSKDIPVKILIGKYTPRNKNQRKIEIIGDKGTAYLDLSSCVLSLKNKKRPLTEVLEIPKKTSSKYYPVIRTALEIFNKNNPFNLKATNVAFKTQTLVLNIANRIHSKNKKFSVYKRGTSPNKIDINIT